MVGDSFKSWSLILLAIKVDGFINNFLSTIRSTHMDDLDLDSWTYIQKGVHSYYPNYIYICIYVSMYVACMYVCGLIHVWAPGRTPIPPLLKAGHEAKTLKYKE